MKPAKTKQPAASTPPLSKKAAQFQQLIADIDQSQQEITQLEAELSEAREFYAKEIKPLHQKQQQLALEITRRVDFWLEHETFTKKERKILEFMVTSQVVNLMGSDLFNENEDIKAEAIGLHDKYAPLTLQEIEAKQKEDLLQEVKAYYRHMGIDVEIDPDDDIEAALEKAQATFEEQNPRGRSKKAKATDPEQPSKKAEKAKTEEKKLSKVIQSIYHNLAKLLHPDLETDDEKRAEKSEAIQRVNAAYEANDLFTLLQFQSTYLHTHSDQIAHLPETQLASFIKLLKNQLTTLDQERYALITKDHWVFENLVGDRGKGAFMRKRMLREEKDFYQTFQHNLSQMQSVDAVRGSIAHLRLERDEAGEWVLVA